MNTDEHGRPIVTADWPKDDTIIYWPAWWYRIVPHRSPHPMTDEHGVPMVCVVKGCPDESTLMGCMKCDAYCCYGHSDDDGVCNRCSPLEEYGMGAMVPSIPLVGTLTLSGVGHVIFTPSIDGHDDDVYVWREP